MVQLSKGHSCHAYGNCDTDVATLNHFVVLRVSQIGPATIYMRTCYIAIIKGTFPYLLIVWRLQQRTKVRRRRLVKVK